MGKWLTNFKEKNFPETLGVRGVIGVIAWDEEKALALWQDALNRMSTTYKPGGLEWARTNFPDMEAAVISAEDRFSEAYKQQDFNGVREAANALGEALGSIITAYKFQALEIHNTSEIPFGKGG